MKELLLQYANYSVWANTAIFNLIASLPETTQKAEVRSSFPSLYGTVLHMLDAESIWWQRLKLQERILRPSDDFTGDFNGLSKILLQQGRAWSEWISAASLPQIEHQFKYQNSKRESFKQPVYEMLLHLFNHNSYHRGQLVTMLRQLGIEKIPSTDFIEWSRK